jgi:GNAT superfamily N-acetyltransferase
MQSTVNTSKGRAIYDNVATSLDNRCLQPDGEAILDHLQTSVPPERFSQLAAGMEFQGSLHPHEPHWYLPWIGMVPQARCTGVSGALLRSGLERADAEGMPAYLEATNRRNAVLYQRFGFEVAGVVNVSGYPEIIAMWRPARYHV